MSSKSNKALYVDQNSEFTIRTDIETHDIEGNELLIETLFSGVNPADIKHATLLGIRSTIVGYDFCGRVLSPPSGSEFSKGDIVAGYTPSGLGRASKYGAHQSYLACPEDMLFRVPVNLPQSHAAALTTVAMTAADALYNFFKYPLPGTPSGSDSSSPILIWGASSSVGICALQFARASGCRNIFVTASKGRHELLKRLGATHCFDYSSSTVTSDINTAIQALGQGPIHHALDAVGTASNPSSADLMLQCVPDSDAKLLSVVLRQDRRFGLPVAMTKADWTIHPPGPPKPISIPARPDDHWRAWKALQWAVENYGTAFELPSVEVFEDTAERALQEIFKVADSGRGFGKLVIRHPMK